VVAVGFVSNHSLQFRTSAILVILFYNAVQSLFFFGFGLVLGYFPARLLAALLARGEGGSAFFYVLSGVLMGVIFLPACASVPYFILPFPEGPAYLERCTEFALPMTIAGAVGGYAFWRYFAKPPVSLSALRATFE
jgi:hypothetical protein